MKVFKILLWLILICILFLGIFAFIIYNLSQPSKDELIEYRLNVPNGVSYMSISQELKENGIIKSAKVFYYYSRIKGAGLKAGVYLVNNKMTFDELHNFLNTGKQEYIVVSIPEGLTITEISKILEDNEICSSIDFIETAKDSNLPESYNIPSSTLEGYLFPDTYYFTPKMNPTDVIEIMINNFFEKLSTISNTEDLTSTELHEIVKLASIVEKEYKVAKEAPLIASVFKNRLRYNIGLYSCATIIYIITEELGLPHPGQVKYSDLKIESPYNTYLHAGLTPTPISNPGIIALDAAINTPKTNYYYFRVEDEVAGTHVFTKDFEDHKNAGN